MFVLTSVLRAVKIGAIGGVIPFRVADITRLMVIELILAISLYLLQLLYR